jgi:hypothetical protein
MAKPSLFGRAGGIPAIPLTVSVYLPVKTRGKGGLHNLLPYAKQVVLQLPKHWIYSLDLLILILQWE